MSVAIAVSSIQPQRRSVGKCRQRSHLLDSTRRGNEVQRFRRHSGQVRLESRQTETTAKQSLIAQPPFSQRVTQPQAGAAGFGTWFAFIGGGVSQEPPGSNWPWERWYNDPGWFLFDRATRFRGPWERE